MVTNVDDTLARARGRSRALLVCIAVALALVGTMASKAEASHFRFGHNPWSRSTGNAVTFNFVQAWRLAADDDLEIDFGDTGVDLGPQVVIGTFSDLAGEQYLVESHSTPHTYASEGPFLASTEDCCRISSLVNAGDESERIETTVDLRNGNTGSPVSSVPVIVQFPQGVTYGYTLPVADPDGDPVTCRMATPAESYIPQVATAGGFSISVSSDCVLTWNTSGTTVGQKYAVQVMLEENHAGNVGKVALDFIVEIAGNVGNSPVCSGVSGNSIVNVGQTFTANVMGTDADGDNLKLGNFGLPPGATLTPPSGTTQAQPFAATFEWTPQAGDAGTAYAVTLVYSDPGGRQGTCAFSLNVPATVCGNETIEPPFEQCDDGNQLSGDGCDANCQLESVCGDGTQDAGEQCDDGNTDACDGCSATCAVEGCGNHVVECSEQCDDGNTESGDGCSESCQSESVCGDGMVEGQEQCDGGECCTGQCTFAAAGVACSDEGNACTDDLCDGSGTCEHPADDSNTCNDGDLCTTGDSCDAGSCVGDEVECAAIDQCHAPGTCDSGTGACSAGPGISCTISGNKDSFLRVSNGNTNEGANPLLRLSGSGPGRPIVSFDLSHIDLAGVSSARLVFTVAENAGGWGSTGRSLDAYPLLSSFAEGNGRQVGLPPAQATRGTGAGVTFNCATDANVANSKSDCASEWNGGAIGAKSSSVNHTNQTLGDVGFDVTADVIAGRSAWLVRKTNEGLTGRVDYFSREGAAAGGDPGLAPRLELEY